MARIVIDVQDLHALDGLVGLEWACAVATYVQLYREMAVRDRDELGRSVVGAVPLAVEDRDEALTHLGFLGLVEEDGGLYKLPSHLRVMGDAAQRARRRKSGARRQARWRERQRARRQE